ncbi:MAG: hypothetical protein R6V83_12555 [Candidatus Thorarchaeota archaeon]
MAEEFLSRLGEIEDSIDSLGDTLKRMVTIMESVTEIRSEVRVARDKILEKIEQQASSTDTTTSTLSQEQLEAVVNDAMKRVEQSIDESLAGLEEQVLAKIEKIPAKAEAPTSQEPEPDTSRPAAAPSLSPDRGMKIADQLEKILDSLKMGCVAGDVLDVMEQVKSDIQKIVPSDPILVTIDKWSGIVKTYSKRHELQARDILKIKRDLRDEIDDYRPA